MTARHATDAPLASAENQVADFEFETFELVHSYKVRHSGKYTFLIKMPKGTHFHFRDPSKNLRSAITDMNRREKERGSDIHFGVYKVGDDDPKGAGVRILRDDRPIRKRTRKVSEAES